MLLPSALTCDSSSTSTQAKTRYQSTLFASPPLSPQPTTSSHPTITNLYSTCRALQSMLAPPSQLPSPPTTHAEPASPFKLRLRARGSTAPAPRKITKRAPAQPPRGINKRRRALADDMSRETAEAEVEDDNGAEEGARPSTPKRMRRAPEVLPLGLERADFQSLHGPEADEAEAEAEEAAKVEEWSTEEDRLLVELVLEKLKLTKSDWQDCARSLGKDRGSVGRRWKSLMGAGEVGLKGRLRRGKIHSTWR